MSAVMMSVDNACLAGGHRARWECDHWNTVTAAAPPAQQNDREAISFSSHPLISATYHTITDAGAVAPAQPAAQPDGFAFGGAAPASVASGFPGASASLPAFSTTAFGAGGAAPGQGQPQAAAGATFGGPQTGSMTLGATPGEASGAAQRRKVKLRRPGRK